MVWKLYLNKAAIKISAHILRFPILMNARMIHPTIQARYLPWQILSLLLFSVYHVLLPISSPSCFFRLLLPFFYHYHPSPIFHYFFPEIFNGQLTGYPASTLICSPNRSLSNSQSIPSKIIFNLINILLKQNLHK